MQELFQSLVGWLVGCKQIGIELFGQKQATSQDKAVFFQILFSYVSILIKRRFLLLAKCQIENEVIATADVIKR